MQLAAVDRVLPFGDHLNQVSVLGGGLLQLPVMDGGITIDMRGLGKKKEKKKEVNSQWQFAQILPYTS